MRSHSQHTKGRIRLALNTASSDVAPSKLTELGVRIEVAGTVHSGPERKRRVIGHDGQPW
jgi:hypothetical protein